MEDLKQEVCSPCRSGGVPASDEEISQWLETLPGWQVQEHENVRQLVKSYSFKNFRQALAFTNRVGEVAESQGHHPELRTEWGKVTVMWWTHAIGGLHKNDFIMAAKTDSALKAD